MITLSNPVLQVLSGQHITPLPVWFMRQAGRHLPEYRKLRAKAKNFLDFCYNSELAAEATLQPVKRYDVDAAILFSDILLIPQALGRRVNFVSGIGPVLDPLQPGDVSKLKRKNTAQKLSRIYETVYRVKADLAPEKILIGFCGGPWTVATYMIEGKGSLTKESAKRFAYEHPAHMTKLLHCLADVSANYLVEQARAGTQVLKIFESWADGLTGEMFEYLIIEPTRRIIKQVRAAGVTCPIIGFPRAAGMNTESFANRVNIDCLALGSDISIKKMRTRIPKKMAIQGNLDPLTLCIGGDVLKRAVEKVLKDSKGPHIFNLGHGISPDVKPENISAVIRHIRTGNANYV